MIGILTSLLLVLLSVAAVVIVFAIAVLLLALAYDVCEDFGIIDHIKRKREQKNRGRKEE